MKNKRSGASLEFLLAFSATFATFSSNALADGSIPHHPALAAVASLLTLGFLVVADIKPPGR
ncbi:MAG: hypothetical protein P4L74_00275 [Candidatus Doudnabacteria bacterium]|nr:hypothetical protein [Candidatus Doudnabacteria bacterium]